MADYMAMESLSHVGSRTQPRHLEVRSAPLGTRRASAQYLTSTPDGCASQAQTRCWPRLADRLGLPGASVVEPDRWIVLDFDPALVRTRSHWQDGGWTFPTVDRGRAARIDPRMGEALHRPASSCRYTGP